jgi:hypothetical protein
MSSANNSSKIKMNSALNAGNGKSFSQKILESGFVTRIGELIQYTPESIVIGSTALGILTNSFPMLVFVIFQFELIGVRRLFSGLTGYLFPTVTEKVGNCENGFLLGANGVKTCILNIFGRGGSFPAGGLFFLSGVFSYLIGSLMSFQSTLETLGSDYTTRIITASVFSLISILIVFFYNTMWGCNSFMGSLGSVILGILFGYLLLVINGYLFGAEGINLIGVPSLATNDKMFYICGEQP